MTVGNATCGFGGASYLVGTTWSLVRLCPSILPSYSGWALYVGNRKTQYQGGAGAGLLLGFGANYWVFGELSVNWQSLIDYRRSRESLLLVGAPTRLQLQPLVVGK